jgi:hypothetical protein
VDATGLRGTRTLIETAGGSAATHTVLHLACDASSFMTGQIFRPNGGVVMPW